MGEYCFCFNSETISIVLLKKRSRRLVLLLCLRLIRLLYLEPPSLCLVISFLLYNRLKCYYCVTIVFETYPAPVLGAAYSRRLIAFVCTFILIIYLFGVLSEYL